MNLNSCFIVYFVFGLVVNYLYVSFIQFIASVGEEKADVSVILNSKFGGVSSFSWCLG